jgi:hypothetical protein
MLAGCIGEGHAVHYFLLARGNRGFIKVEKSWQLLQALLTARIFPKQFCHTPPEYKLRLRNIVSRNSTTDRKSMIMAPATSRYSSIVELILILLIVLPFSQALKFDLVAHSGHSSKNERCIRNFVNKDTLVVVTAIISGNRGDGQVVNMHVSGVNAAIPQSSPSTRLCSCETERKQS